MSERNSLRLTNRGKAAAIGGMLALGASVGAVGHAKYNSIQAEHKLHRQLNSGDVNATYEKGEINPNKVVKITVTEEGTAWDFADRINANKSGAVETLSSEISHQVGPDGAQPGETVIVSADYVDHAKASALQDR